MSEGKKFEVKLSELDIKIVLEALGNHERMHANNRESTKATRNVIDRIYRAMGVRLDR